MEKIKYAQVEEYCNEMHATANRMKSLLDDVSSKCSLLTSSEAWCGKASDFYTGKMKKLISNFDDVYKELENAILYMANCSEGYDVLDKNTAKEILNNLHISYLHCNSKIFPERM